MALGIDPRRYFDYAGPSPMHDACRDACRDAMMQEAREKELYLRECAPAFVKRGYHLSELVLHEKCGEYKMFTDEKSHTVSYTITYQLKIGKPQTRAMLALRRRKRRFTGGVGWRAEKELGLL